MNKLIDRFLNYMNFRLQDAKQSLKCPKEEGIDISSYGYGYLQGVIDSYQHLKEVLESLLSQKGVKK